MRRPLIGLLVALTVACSNAPPVDAAKTLRDGGAAMGNLKTVTANLKFTKGAISFQGFTLVNAKTSVRIPGDSDTVYTVKQQDLTIGLEVVIAGGHIYLHVPFSAFREVSGPDAASIPDLAKLFDPTTGLPAVIPAGSNPTYVSTDTLGGTSTNQISAGYNPDQVHSMLTQLNSSSAVAAHLWIGASDHLIRKAVLDGAFGDGGKEASVEVNMSGFDQAVNITTPTP
jgi:hypothetical protein